MIISGTKEVMTKFVFVTGGVVSSLGKGIAAASLAAILASRGVRVTNLKLDPYINVDPGTMSPFQHGEVFVTDDGAETDLDLGHYERFTDVRMGKRNNFTTGQIYEIGDPQGAPRRLPRRHGAGHPAHHRRDQELDHAAGAGEARSRARRSRRHRRRHRVAAVPRSDPPDGHHARPRQRLLHPPDAGAVHPVRGRDEDQADAALGEGAARDRHPARRRALPRRPADPGRRPPQDRAVHQRPAGRRDPGARRRLDLQDPGHAARGGPRRHRLQEARRSTRRPPISSVWHRLVDALEHPAARGRHRDGRQVRRPHRVVQVAVRGARSTPASTRAPRSTSTTSTPKRSRRTASSRCAGMDAILVPGGFGKRGVEGKIKAVRFAREHGIPYLGICLGMQLAIIECARHMAGLGNANSTEFDPDTPHPVVALITEWQNRDGSIEKRSESSDLGGTMRLGAQPCEVVPGSLAHRIYGSTTVAERHRHRYEVNNHYLPRIEAAGLAVGARAKSALAGDLVEMVELPGPSRGSSAASSTRSSRPIPRRGHPLFISFVQAALEHQRQARDAATRCRAAARMAELARSLPRACASGRLEREPLRLRRRPRSPAVPDRGAVRRRVAPAADGRRGRAQGHLRVARRSRSSSSRRTTRPTAARTRRFAARAWTRGCACSRTCASRSRCRC